MLKRSHDGSALAMMALSILLAGCGASNTPSRKAEVRQTVVPRQPAPSSARPEPGESPDELFPVPPTEDPAPALSRCEQGDMEACRAAGWLFLHGFGVVEDAARASDLYIKACHGKNTKACMEFAVEYHHRHDWPTKGAEELVEAGYHELACDHGEKQGCLALALGVLRHPKELHVYRNSVGKTAQKTAEDACAASHVAACSTLLEVAQRDDDEPRAEALAAKLLAMCRAGELRACEPALFYSWPNKTPEERTSIRKETGLPWCKFSQAECRAGRAERCSFALTCIGQGNYDPRGPAAAAELTYHACVDGRDFKRCAALADRFESADGVPRDPEKASFFDLAACQHGDYDGCWRTANRLMKQESGPQNDKKIFEIAKMGCRIDLRDSGWLRSCEQLARMYETGTGTPKDIEKAVEIFTTMCRHRGRSCKDLGRLQRPIPPPSTGEGEP